MMRLVRVPTAVSDAVLADCLADLPFDEWRVQHPRQRRRVVAYAVLRRLLGERLNIAPHCVPLARQPWGKPVLASAALEDDCSAVHFSVSYTGDEALLALAESPVGVDIEGVAPDDAVQVARHIYTDEECARLHGAQPDQAFLDIWTAKEAVLKFLGTGFHVEPRKFCVPPAAQDFQPVCVAQVSSQTPSCVVAGWHMKDGVTVAVSMAYAPSSMTWERYAH